MALNTTSNQQDGEAGGLPTDGDAGASDIFDRLWIEKETGQPVTPDPSEDVIEGEDADPQEETDESGTDDDTAEQDDEPEEPSFEATVGGEKRQVKVSELVRGYQRLSDYTRKTQEVADIRRSLEERAAIIEQAEARALALLEQYDPQEPEPDWVALQQQDPMGFQEKLAQYQQRQSQMRAAQAERERIQQEQQQRFVQQRREMLHKEAEALFAKLPEAKGDRNKAQAIVSEALKHAGETYAFTPEELKSVTDHRLILMARDAQRWRQLAKAKPSTAAAVGATPKVARPGQAGSTSAALRDRVSAAKTRLAQTGDPNAFEQLWIQTQRAGR